MWHNSCPPYGWGISQVVCFEFFIAYGVLSPGQLKKEENFIPYLHTCFSEQLIPVVRTIHIFMEDCMGISKSITALILALILFSGCKGPEGPMGPVGPAGQGIGSLSDPSIMPKVIYTYPPANSVGPYENFYQFLTWIYYPWLDRIYPVPTYISQFQVRFNKFMDITSIRRAAAITSPFGDVRVDTNFVFAIGGDVFLINPVDTNGNRVLNWKIGQNYTFTVSSVARDINGNILQPSFSMTFMPEPYFRVRTISPANGAVNVSPVGYYITLNLNSKVDTSFHSFIYINPPVAGQWNLSSDSISLYYTTNQTLRSLTTYTISIGTDAHDIYHNYLQQPFHSTFTTLPFGVTSTYPSNGNTDINVMDAITVVFTEQLDTSTVRTAFSTHPSINGQYNLYYSAEIDLSPLTELLIDSAYTVTIDTSIRGVDGAKLPAPYSFSFRTAPFRVSSTYPYSGMTGFNPNYNPVEVFFNALIDTGSVRAAFSLLDSSNTPVNGYYTMYTNGFYFTPLTALKPYASYKATVATGLRAKQGKYINAPYLLSFTTGSQ